ncbi:VOC family protein [Hansschlegelia beijingensis]|uniref:VOC family protein n=1 Tax=Hansschlegelia beijingensis TaxID=1133344 RepID=UPI00387EF9B4
MIETAVYVESLDRAVAFYDRLFALPHLFENNALVALDVAGRSVLLLFARGASAQTQTPPGGVIPGHDASGRIHFAFAADDEQLPLWEARLAEEGVPIEGRVTWPRGGTSVYFRDPDGNLLELATPGIWTTY